MSKHLNEELGSRYVQEFYTRAFFEHGGKLHMVRAVESSSIHVDSMELDSEDNDWERTLLPADVLKDFSSFAYPTLGYREYEGPYGKYVTFVSTKRSAHRGLRDDHLFAAHLPIYNAMPHGGMSDYFWDMNRSRRLRALFRPSFTPFKQGIKLLLEGETAAFAVNEQLAVGISTQSADRAFDIYFRQRPVGWIGHDGNLSLSNKVVNRPSLRQALET